MYGCCALRLEKAAQERREVTVWREQNRQSRPPQRARSAGETYQQIVGTSGRLAEGLVVVSWFTAGSRLPRTSAPAAARGRGRETSRAVPSPPSMPRSSPNRRHRRRDRQETSPHSTVVLRLFLYVSVVGHLVGSVLDRPNPSHTRRRRRPILEANCRPWHPHGAHSRSTCLIHLQNPSPL